MNYLNLPAFLLRPFGEKPRKLTLAIIVHCSDTPARMDVDVEEIDRWHKERGWKGVGYHFIVKRSGEVEKGRETDSVGSHVLGMNNSSVGVCLVGGRADKSTKPEQNFTPEQYAALKELITQLWTLYPDARLGGHRDYDNAKACPSFDVEAWAEEAGI